jgi:predicted nuclease with TOPRIM domain
MDANPAEFDRGVAAGEVSQRLKSLEGHNDKLNGSLDKIADKLGGLTLAVQRLDDRMKANQETVATTAEAVEKERDATATAVEKVRTTTRDAAELRWSPLARITAAVGALAASAGAGAGLWSLFHK